MFEWIYASLLDIFRDSRIAVVVTKMDERHSEVRESERLSEEQIKQIVSTGISRALQLEWVSPDIVFPISGKWALEVSNLYA